MPFYQDSLEPPCVCSSGSSNFSQLSSCGGITGKQQQQHQQQREGGKDVERGKALVAGLAGGPPGMPNCRKSLLLFLLQVLLLSKPEEGI